MKQVTIRLEALATVEVADDWDGKLNSIPMKLEVFDSSEDESSPVIQVVETDITYKYEDIYYTTLKT